MNLSPIFGCETIIGPQNIRIASQNKATDTVLIVAMKGGKVRGTTTKSILYY
jgi:hypothetical protein